LPKPCLFIYFIL